LIDLRQCDGICKDCVKGYVKKHNLKRGDNFRVPCFGIPEAYLSDDILASVGGDPEIAISMLDPVTWAAEFLDWHCLDPEGAVWKRMTDDGSLPEESNPYDEEVAKMGKAPFHRPYQAQMLRCSSKRKAFRLGRQCLTENTLVQLTSGKVVSIKEVRAGDSLFSVNTSTYKLESDTVVDSWSSGSKPVYRIRTKFGHEIECTNNHPFLSISRFCDYKNGYTIEKLPRHWSTISSGLQVGHKIAVPIVEPVFGTKPLPLGLPELLGYFIADGSCAPKQSAKFTNITEEYLNEFTSLCKSFGSEVKPYPKGNGFDLIISNGRRQPNPVREIIFKHGLGDIRGPDKRVPKAIFEAPKEQIAAFMNRLWSADGYVSSFKRTGRETYRTEIGVLQENKLLVQDIQRLLWRFGVHGYIKQEDCGYRYVVSNKNGVINFLNNIGPVKGKETACSVAMKITDSTGDKYGKTEKDILWDYVSKIEYLGEQETYDIEVKNNHNFIANGILTHNSGKTEALCIAMLHGMFTHSKFKVVVIAPFQSQIELIFSRLQGMIQGNPLLSASVTRNVKAPNYAMELANGSRVRGFTAGTRSGQGAGSVRGQDASMLIFDEADMLCADDVNAASAIITNHPKATVWMSSTPTGKREHFYTTCNSRIFKEFHYPSQINPNWSDELEDFFHEQLTEDGYKHEVLAQFGEQEEGVYQAKYVEIAQSEYKYSEQTVNPNWHYSMGVDWNDRKVGVTIVVVGYDPANGLFYLVDKQIVSRGDYTQLAACEKVAEYNRLWNPFTIYIDRGFGATQYEVLRKFGFDSIATKGKSHPDSKLSRIVKAYDFGGTIETHDLFTKELVKKPAKPFLVENSVRRFETCTIKYPKSDDKFTSALLGYIVKRMTMAGMPVYEQENTRVGDHVLDAVNLALVAFTLEKTPFGKPKYDNTIAYSPGIGLIDGDTGKHISAESHKPQSGRADFANVNTISKPDLPAAHTNKEAGVKIWNWPGFGHDAPRPKSRSMQQASNDARKRIGMSPRRPSAPKRRKF